MSEENKQDGQGTPKTNLIPAVVQSKLSLDMVKAHGNYQQTLKNILEFEVTYDNFEEAQQLLKKIIGWLGFVDDHRTAEKKPYLEAGRIIDATHKTFLTPFEEAKNQLQARVNEIGRKKEEEARKAFQEKQRIEGLQNLINQFILDSATKIAAANTNEQLLKIERLINLEKANKARYQDHLPLLIERCNELTDKIRHQKDLVKEVEKVENEKKQAIEQGDDEKVQELLTQSEVLDNQLKENTILVQETASSSIILTEVVAPEIDMPSTRHRKWKFEIIDPKEIMKKKPELLKVELDFKKTTEMLNTLKDSGILNGKTEYTLNGIRFFLEKTF